MEKRQVKVTIVSKTFKVRAEQPVQEKDLGVEYHGTMDKEVSCADVNGEIKYIVSFYQDGTKHFGKNKGQWCLSEKSNVIKKSIEHIIKEYLNDIITSVHSRASRSIGWPKKESYYIVDLVKNNIGKEMTCSADKPYFIEQVDTRLYSGNKLNILFHSYPTDKTPVELGIGNQESTIGKKLD